MIWINKNIIASVYYNFECKRLKSQLFKKKRALLVIIRKNKRKRYGMKMKNSLRSGRIIQTMAAILNSQTSNILHLEMGMVFLVVKQTSWTPQSQLAVGLEQGLVAQLGMLSEDNISQDQLNEYIAQNVGLPTV